LGQIPLAFLLRVTFFRKTAALSHPSSRGPLARVRLCFFLLLPAPLMYNRLK
jgi:hypothetical protein